MPPPEWRETCDDRHSDGVLAHRLLAPRHAQGRRRAHCRLQPRRRAAAGAAARGDVAGPPDPNAIDSWIAIHADNTATVYFGKCELGQGNTTGMLQIAAEELDLAMSQVSAARLDTNVTPNQGATSSSSSIERGGPQLRAAAAEARRALLLLASRRLGVQINSLVVNGRRGLGRRRRRFPLGQVRRPPRRQAVQRQVHRHRAAEAAEPLQARRHAGAARRPAGQDERQATSWCIICACPACCTAAWCCRAGKRAFGAGAKPLSVDESSIKHIPTARVVRKGDFVGVVAENEWDAVKAAAALKVTWQDGPALPGNADLFTHMRAQKTTDTVIANRGDVDEGLCGRGACALLGLFLSVPGAPAVRAELRAGRCPPRRRADPVVDPGRLQRARRCWPRVLGMDVKKVRVQYYEGSGTFGRSCYEDAAQAAAIMSQAVGRPVRVQYMRWDEHGWDNYGPAHLAEVRAGVDAEGKLVAYEYHGWQHGWTVTSTIQDIALQKPGVERASGSNSITVNPMSTGSMYVVPNRRVISHAVPMAGYLRGAALRSPLDLSFAFASEQTIDELAHALKMDPFEFRRRNIGDKRWLGVLEAAAKAADWKPRVMASSLSNDEVVRGRGIGLGTHHVSYGAAVADIEVNKRTGVIVATHLYGALDCGLAVNPARSRPRSSAR